MRLSQVAVCCALVLAVLAAAASACDRGSPTQPSGIVELDLAEATRHYEQDFRRYFDSEFTVRYEGELTTLSGDTTRLDVTWFKDGNRRQRWDTPALLGGEELAITKFQIFTEGDRWRLLLCAAELPRNPDHELGEGETGACYDDPASLSDIVANAIFFMGFPSQFPEELPGDYFDSLGETEFTRHWEETIAGDRARCYSARGESREIGEDGELIVADFCYSRDGAELFRHTSGGIQNDVTLRAVTYQKGVQAQDFDLPYPVIKPDRSDD